MRYGIGDDLTAAIRCYQGHQHRERWKEPRRKRAERRACPAALHSASKLGGEMVARYFSETFDCVAANNPGLCKLKLACLATVSLPRTPPGSDCSSAASRSLGGRHPLPLGLLRMLVIGLCRCGQSGHMICLLRTT